MFFLAESAVPPMPAMLQWLLWAGLGWRTVDVLVRRPTTQRVLKALTTVDKELSTDSGKSLKDQVNTMAGDLKAVIDTVNTVAGTVNMAATAAADAAKVGRSALNVAELAARQGTALLKRTKNLETNQREMKDGLTSAKKGQDEINAKFARFVHHEAKNDLSDSQLAKDVDRYLAEHPKYLERPEQPETTPKE